MNLSPATKVTVQVSAIFGCVALVVGATWTTALFYGRLASLERDHYGITAASEQALRQAIANPGHRVPDPRDPNKLIVVEDGQVGAPGASSRGNVP